MPAGMEAWAWRVWGAWAGRCRGGGWAWGCGRGGKDMVTMRGQHMDTGTGHGAWGNGHRDFDTNVGGVAQVEDRVK